MGPKLNFARLLIALSLRGADHKDRAFMLGGAGLNNRALLFEGARLDLARLFLGVVVIRVASWFLQGRDTALD